MIKNWTPEFHNADVKPSAALNNNLSEDVLIDLTGWRLNFRVGFYDFKEQRWCLYDKEAERLIDLKGMKWTELPLNKG